MSATFCEEAILAAVEAVEQDRIQGFYYGRRYVIRDLCRNPSDQVIWQGPDTNEHAFHLQCEIERMRIVLLAALSAQGGMPYPADQVPMPQNAEQAKAMWLIGERWCRDNPASLSPSTVEAGK